MAEQHFDVLIIGAGHLRHRRRPATSPATARARPTRSSSAGTRSAAPGTCSATPASARTRTCTPSAINFRPWTRDEDPRRRAVDPAVRRARPRPSTASPSTSSSAARCSPRAGRARDERWTVVATDEATGQTETYTAATCSAAPATTTTTAATGPTSPARTASQGQIVHPQHWPEDLDYAGKRVVIIGSGATADHARAGHGRDAAHVTMLQRSPTYIIVAAGRRHDLGRHCARSLPGERRLQARPRPATSASSGRSTQLARSRPDARAQDRARAASRSSSARTST